MQREHLIPDTSFDTTFEEEDSGINHDIKKRESEVIEINDDTDSDEEDKVVVPSLKRIKRVKLPDDKKDILKDVGLSRSNSSSIFDIVKRISNSPTKVNQKIPVTDNEAPVLKPLKPVKKNDDRLENKHNDKPWCEKYAPRTIDDLIIHKKKKQDLIKAISSLINGDSRSRMLVVSGRSGTGKSISCKIIANELMKEYNERNKLRNKIRTNLMGFDNLSEEDNDNNDEETEFENLVEFKNFSTSTSKLTSSVIQFEEFLNGCKLIQDKLIFIEELPNLNHFDTMANFQKAIRNWFDIDHRIRLPPLILCITDFDIESDNMNNSNKNVFSIDTNYLCETILGFRLMKYENKLFGWTRIKFNPMAKTIIKKGLQKIISKENKIMNEKKVNELTEFTGGDFRNSINLLEFYYKFGFNDSSKDSNLNLFHLIGKIIYGTQHSDLEITKFSKSMIGINETIDDLRKEINLIICINLGNEISNQSFKFKECLFENYNMINEFNQKVKDDKIVDNLSLCDGIKENDEISLLISTYGTRINMKNGGSTSNKMKFSRESKVRKRIKETNEEIEKYLKNKRFSASNKVRLSHEEINLIDGFYVSKIMNSRKKKKQQQAIGSRVRRLGGDFNRYILADTEIGDADIENEEKSRSINELDYYEEEINDDNGEDDEFDDDPLIDSEDEDNKQKGYESFEFSDEDNEFIMNL